MIDDLTRHGCVCVTCSVAEDEKMCLQNPQCKGETFLIRVDCGPVYEPFS